MRDDHDGGLQSDLRLLAKRMGRRDVLRWLAGASVIPLIGCGTGGSLPSESTDLGGGGGGGGAGGGGGGGGGSNTSCSTIPEETAGPYPGDGSNGPNVLNQSGIVRSDIRGSFGAMSGTAAGVPLTIQMNLRNVNAACAGLASYAVYLWHCDRDGKYSLYTITTESYLRGVQAADGSGTITFQSIFPGCYSGRWPHVHFEVYRSLGDAGSVGNKIKTSQIALPTNACNAVYATSGYESSVNNFKNVSLASDMVFSDGYTLELASVSGDTVGGFTATLDVAVAG